MAILHSCCLWSSVRRGTFASACYTLIYFSSCCIILSNFLHDQRGYLSGKTSKPVGDSFLERESISPTSVIFSIILLFCSAVGILGSLLVILGLKIDRRELLLPWIFIMILNTLVEFGYFIYLLILELQFEPLTAVLYTIDFFIICLNVYCLLCVISQYQEYKAGRGGARHDLISQPITVHYVPPTATNTCINSTSKQIKNQSSIVNSPYANSTVFTDETTQNNGKLGKYPIQQAFNRRNSNSLKKHVQFPDDKRKNSIATQILHENESINEQQRLDPIILVKSSPPTEYSKEILNWKDQKNNQSIPNV